MIQRGSSPGGGDFEVVPAAVSDGDVDMWDVENKNEDEIKQGHIQSMLPVPHRHEALIF